MRPFLLSPIYRIGKKWKIEKPKPSTILFHSSPTLHSSYFQLYLCITEGELLPGSAIQDVALSNSTVFYDCVNMSKISSEVKSDV